MVTAGDLGVAYVPSKSPGHCFFLPDCPSGALQSLWTSSVGTDWGMDENLNWLAGAARTTPTPPTPPSLPAPPATPPSLPPPPATPPVAAGPVEQAGGAAVVAAAAGGGGAAFAVLGLLAFTRWRRRKAGYPAAGMHPAPGMQA